MSDQTENRVRSSKKKKKEKTEWEEKQTRRCVRQAEGRMRDTKD